jgi:Fungal chitosanase of glycosyl hydrolase group 75
LDIFARSGLWRRIAPSQGQWMHGSLIAITSGGNNRGGSDATAPIDTAELVATLKEKPGGAGALRNVKIFKLKSRPGFCFKAAMAIDVDGSPRAYTAGATKPPALDGPGSVDAEGFATMYIQQREKAVNGVKRVGEGPFKDFFVSRTSLLFKSSDAHKCSNFVDAELIPYVVFPDRPNTFAGVALGDMAYVIDTTNGRATHAIFADTNPKVGEASLRVAQNLGRSDLNAANGEESDRFVYLIFPGTRFEPVESAPHWPDEKIKEEADKAFAAWGGMAQVKALFG